MSYNVLVTSGFKKSLKSIAKKHRSIKEDLAKLIEELELNPTSGIDLGSGFYKIRMPISGSNKGKSGGARIITYVVFVSKEVFLAQIYLKSDFDTIDIASLSNELKQQGIS